MNVYDLLNLNKLDKKEKIEETIQEAKQQLTNLTVQRTCRIYCEEVRQGLLKRHILNRVIDTGDYGYPYSHQFVLVPIDEEQFYLIDLTFPQFSSNEMENLKENGYQVVGEDSFQTYMNIVGQENKNISLREVFENESIKRK